MAEFAAAAAAAEVEMGAPPPPWRKRHEAPNLQVPRSRKWRHTSDVFIYEKMCADCSTEPVNNPTEKTVTFLLPQHYWEFKMHSGTPAEVIGIQ